MPAPTAPTNVEQTVTSTQVTANWIAVAGAAGYDFRVVNPMVVGATPYSTNTTADGTKTTWPFDTTGWAPGWEDDVQVQVRARSVASGTDPSPSAWAGAYLWHVEPSITVTIGGQLITLTRVPAIDGSQKFSLVNSGSPIVVKVSDLVTYITSLASDLGLPTLPGVTIAPDDTLTIERFTISTGGFFDLGLTLALGAAGWTVFPGLTVNSLGLSVLHSNVSAAA